MTLEVENQSGQRFVGSAVLARANDVALTAWHVDRRRAFGLGRLR